MFGNPAAFEHVAKLLLAPAPARLGRVAQRVDQLRRLARHALGALAHRRDLAVEHAKGVAPFRLDLAQSVLIFLQTLVDRVQQRLQILPGALFDLLEERVGAFETRLLRPDAHRLSDPAKLSGESGQRTLAASDLALETRRM